MLAEVELQNFRGFDHHELPLAPFTVLVGQNNAGKSTAVEALRVLALAMSRSTTVSYRRPPSWTDRPNREHGIKPSLRNVEIDLETLPHSYRDPPSLVRAVTDAGATVSCYLGPRGLFAVLAAPDGGVARTQSSARRIGLPNVSIMPQLGPVQREEDVLSKDYVRANLDSHLASWHFRNQLNAFPDLLPQFRANAEETWPGVQIRELEGQGDLPGRPLSLLVRDEDYVGEVGAMGHGLQMWLQMVWFLTRSEGTSTIILDEPDVYLHPDLQRRLIRFLRGRFDQVILTSHSVELIAEVEPDEVLVVDRRRSGSRFATDLQAVQDLLDGIGSAHNVHLARLWRSRRLLLVEGDDVQILQRLHRVLYPRADSLGAVPRVSIGGWGGWQRAIGSSMVVKNSLGERIRRFCLLDRDYHSPKECAQRMREAKRHDIHLHIWRKKELENYLLSPKVIARYLSSRARNRKVRVEADEIGRKLHEIALELKSVTLDEIANELQHANRGWSVGKCNREARDILERRCPADRDLVSAVSGKAVLSRLSGWASQRFGVGISAVGLAGSFRDADVPSEIRKVLAAIEEGESIAGIA